MAFPQTFDIPFSIGIDPPTAPTKSTSVEISVAATPFKRAFSPKMAPAGFTSIDMSSAEQVEISVAPTPFVAVP